MPGVEERVGECRWRSAAAVVTQVIASLGRWPGLPSVVDLPAAE